MVNIWASVFWTGNWETLTTFSFSKSKTNEMYVNIESKIYKAQIFCVCPGDMNFSAVHSDPLEGIESSKLLSSLNILCSKAKEVMLSGAGNHLPSATFELSGKL